MQPALSDEQVAKFAAEGFLVLEGFASPEEVAALKARGEELAAGFDPESISVFSTKNQAAKTDAYFLDSASSVSFFFEEGAFGPDGQLRQPVARSLNKIGHALHDLDPVFRRWSRGPAVQALMASLGFRRPLPVQSMLIFKQPFCGGEVVPHQDSSFIATAPSLSCVGIWLALEDATRDNGCLWALPGSHHEGVHRRFLRAPDGSVRFDAGSPSFEDAAFTPVEVKAGSLVLLHGANVHMSKENTSPASRHAYSIHFVESGSPDFCWAPDNWLQRRPDVPFEPLFDHTASEAAASSQRPPAYAHSIGGGGPKRVVAPAPAPPAEAAAVAGGARPY